MAHRRRWYQFQLQTVLLLVALLGMAIAWALDHHRLAQQLKKAKETIQFLKTSRFFDEGATPAPIR